MHYLYIQTNSLMLSSLVLICESVGSYWESHQQILQDANLKKYFMNESPWVPTNIHVSNKHLITSLSLSSWCKYM